MPKYDFRCSHCSELWSSIFSITEYITKELFSCPHCKSENDKQSRDKIGVGLVTNVVGVSKGNYNSGDRT